MTTNGHSLVAIRRRHSYNILLGGIHPNQGFSTCYSQILPKVNEGKLFCLVYMIIGVPYFVNMTTSVEVSH